MELGMSTWRMVEDTGPALCSLLGHEKLRFFLVFGS